MSPEAEKSRPSEGPAPGAAAPDDLPERWSAQRKMELVLRLLRGESLGVGWHTAKIGDRWAALAPIRQGVQHAFGAFRKDVAHGLGLRCDWGPQYIAQAWLAEVKWLGITISPSYVGEPECNGVAERFIRTLKEQCLYLHRFRNVAEARAIIGAFIDRYNSQWLIERLGHRTPAQARADAQAPRAA